MRRLGVVGLGHERGAGFAIATTALLLAAQIAAAPFAFGQDELHSDEVLLGTIDIGTPVAPAASTAKSIPSEPQAVERAPTAPSVAAAPSSAQDATATLNAVRFYTSALKSLETGDFSAAQRLFEKVIEADPRGERAADARRHLGQLYTAAADARGAATGAPLIKPEPPAATAPPSPATWTSTDDAARDGATDARTAEQSSSPAASPPAATLGPPAPSLALPPTANRSPAPAIASRRAPSSGSDDERFVTEIGDRVFFSAGSAELGGRARAVLSAQAVFLAQRPEWYVSIEGHADDAPMSDAEMEDLSEARADAVRQRLIFEGVAEARIQIVPWGHSAPVATCSEPACQAQNRRAVSVLTPRRNATYPPRAQSNAAGPPGPGAGDGVGVPQTASRSDQAER